METLSDTERLVVQIKNHMDNLRRQSKQCVENIRIETERANMFRDQANALETILDKWAEKSPNTAKFQS